MGPKGEPMATSTATGTTHGFIPARMHTSCDFTQVLMKLQRATYLIASTLDLDALLDRVVNDIASSLGNVEVAVWLRSDDTDEMILQGVRGCSKFCKGERLRMGHEGIVGHVAATGKMRYAPDVSKDPYYIGCEPETRSEVAIPLKAGRRVIGVISIDHRQIDAYSPDQLKVLQAIAGHTAIAVENARVFQNEREMRERLQQESSDARAIQEAIFLKPVPLIPGFAIEAAWHPAGSVAGDWYDFIDLGEERYGIALADVSGKGMPAALLMSATRALLRSIAPLEPSPSRTLERLNRTLLEDSPPASSSPWSTECSTLAPARSLPRAQDTRSLCSSIIIVLFSRSILACHSASVCPRTPSAPSIFHPAPMCCFTATA